MTASKAQVDDAVQYLDKHRVPWIIQQLTTALLNERPANPKAFIITKLEEIRNARLRGEAVNYFTHTDLEAIFRIYDVTGSGYINLEQYKEAMKSIGAEGQASDVPEGAYQNKISSKAFVAEA